MQKYRKILTKTSVVTPNFTEIVDLHPRYGVTDGISFKGSFI